ncbi:MAG TPA: MFS transporter [Marinilabiliales bacterium]|nr:MAG: MFS transporter [Bacteroidetes bacterium GWA2_40_14]OFX72858.1 MAG: MFS transporter [Bacteroidetes bacterium GWD2_40_43]OFX93551.1 MAG: MFS transporter [Bacteroidetes bacterium GWE2_40_63]OFY18299.1 MAG: MFS transporter [Bacteroidetes bacterium GWF2_40_13]OFZ27520.1 MAG: MFS transporter [Bacteroidetes bacterium RIFOXYC2_FULL_40_12]HAM99896.1 MFS transporter [Marinilabiliales bacterium]
MTLKTISEKMTNYRWAITSLLFFATTINYLDRQVLSLTWKDFIAPEFHWTNNDYGNITALFSIFYAVSLLVAGRLVDRLDTKKGFLWAIGVWSVGAVLHAFSGIATSGIVAGKWLVGFEGAKHAIGTVGDAGLIVSVSVTFFIIARFVLALGEAGNFPAAIKATAEYFPKKDRAFSTSIFNAGATVGALVAPISVPVIAVHFGWEMAFIIIGALGFIWMGFWVFMYKKPHQHHKVNKAELDYINQDSIAETAANNNIEKEELKISFINSFKYKQTWAFAFGKFMTDGVWWFYLFWTPAYLSDVYGLTSDSTMAQVLLFVLYVITLLSIIGGWLPTYFVDKKGMNPYAGRMRSMLIFAFFPLLALLAQPLGLYSYWFPVIIIGIAGAAHQAWSANIFSSIGDMFPKSAIATITGIGGMAGGVGSFLINKGSGLLFDYSLTTNMKFFGFEGIKSGYFIIFSICAVAYLIGWVVMKSLVPVYKPIIE